MVVMHAQWLAVLVVVCAATTQGGGECITGLVDTATLALWSEQYGATINLDAQSNVQFIFPEIRFRCNGTVTKWIIGAQFDGADSQYPVMGAYRDMGIANQSTRISRRLFIHPEESSLRLYEYVPPNPQPFQSGDILGLFQPHEDNSRLQLLFGEVNGATHSFSRGSGFDANGLTPFNTDGEGLTSRTDRLPLVAVEIESDDPDSADCTRDFISRDLLELLLVSSLSGRQDGRQFVFPNYNFSCAGLIMSWSLGLVEPRGGDDRINYPQLQIWRRNMGSGDFYDRIASTELTATAETPNQLYSLTIDPPLQFQSGDLLGMYLPREESDNGRLRVLFGDNVGPIYQFTGSNAPLSTLLVDGDSDNERPYLALELSEQHSLESVFPTASSSPSTLNSMMGSATTTPASTTVSVTTAATPAPSRSPPTTAVTSASPPTELLPVIAIAVGASVGGVAVGAVSVLVIVAALACARKKKQNPTDKSVYAIDMTAIAEETYDYPLQRETTAVATKRNKAYATNAITTEQNKAYTFTAIPTEQNEAYASNALPTAPNAAYSNEA